MSSTFEFWLELAWLGAKCRDKTLLVIEIFYTFFNTALLSESSIVTQYSKKNMINFSQQPVTEQQKIVFPAHNLNLEGYKIKSTLPYKIFSTLKNQVTKSIIPKLRRKKFRLANEFSNKGSIKIRIGIQSFRKYFNPFCPKFFFSVPVFIRG